MPERAPKPLHLQVLRAIAFVLIPLAVAGLVLGPEIGVHSPRMAMGANRNAAISTLRTLGDAQREFHAFAFVDVDGDGIGEFGTIAELAGASTLRGTDLRADPPFVPSALGDVGPGGVATRQGYHFRIDLPATDGTGLAVACGHGAAPEPDLAERLWQAYAWPVEHGVTGDAAFHMDAAGTILRVFPGDGRYSGLGGAPHFDAALVETRRGDLSAETASGARGNDGLVWEVLGR